MAEFNIEAMSLKELKSLQKDLAKAISTFEDRQNVRRRMIWNSLADFGAEGAGSSGSDYAAWR